MWRGSKTMASSSTATFTMPLPKLPMAELVARVRESLDKMDKQEAEEKQRREALEERRWREKCNQRSHDGKSPLSTTWASAAAAGETSVDDEELEPLEAKAVGSSSQISPATDFNSAGPPSLGNHHQAGPSAAAAPKDIIPEEELIRRRRVELELIALSKKITEEKLRKERMVPLVWDKPTFDPFSSGDTAAAAAASSSSRSTPQGGELESKGGEQEPNPRKRRNDHDEGKKPYRNLRAIGVPPQARAYYSRDESDFGCHRPTPEEIEDFVAFVHKWMPSDPNWRKRFESDDDEDKTSEM
jgi:hypothetical protein